MKKHISDMNDKEFDDFLKNRISIPPKIAYREEDWKAMRQLLDKDMPSTSGNWDKKQFLGLLALLITAVSTWFIFANMNSTPKSFEDVGTNKYLITNISLRTQNLNEFTIPIVSVDKKTMVQNIHTDQTKLLTGDHIRDYSNGENTVSRPAANPQNRSETSRPTSERVFPILPLHQKTEINPYHSLDVVTQQRDILGTSPNRPVLNPHRSKGRFSISLMLAPDISAIEMNRIQNPGRSIAVNIEYFFHRRWSLNSGLIHAYKTYKGGEGYRVYYQPSPVGLEGNCWIIDVPINVRFYALDKPSQRLFLSTGMSSYFMLREEYNLFYNPYGGNPYTEKVDTQNSNNHYLNVINISLGYERKLTDRLALQAEPYFKTPIEGIGEGELSLKSVGVFFGFKYYW